MNKYLLSIVIITKNEAKRIGRCCESFAGLPAEIIIVDDGSTDETVKIAKERFNACVIEYCNEGKVAFFNQRNKGIDAANSNWILQFDADEVMTDGLKKEILEIVNAPLGDTKDIYEIVKRDCVFGVVLNNLVIPPGAKLFKKNKARYCSGAIHESLQIEKGSSVGKLKGYTLHYNHETIASTVDKYNYYTSVEAVEYVARFDKIDSRYIKKQLWKTPRLFFKHFIRNRAFKDGIYGLVWALINIIHPMFFWLKVIEVAKKERKLL